MEKEKNVEVKESKRRKILIIIVLLIIFFILGLISAHILSGNKKNENNTISKSEESVENKKTNPLQVIGIDEEVYNLDGKYEEKIVLEKDRTAKISVDLDKDGIEENLSFLAIDDENTQNTKIDFYVNNERADIIETERFKADLNIYIVDIDTSDSYLNVAVSEDVSNGSINYIFYEYDGNKINKINNFAATDTIYYSENGKIVSSYTVARYFVESNPIIADSYYDCKDNKTKNTDLSKYSNTLVTLTNASFTKDLKNEDKFINGQVVMNSDETFEEYLGRLDIKVYPKMKAYIMEIVDDHLKVKLEDGTEGYIVGPWGG